MKFFSKDGKFNFVDKNNVFVGFDNSSQCCESFGFYYTDEWPSSKDEILDETNNYNPELEDYVFDRDFCAEIKLSPCGDGGTATFKLVHESKPSVYLTLYNHHNGYYTHGFTMELSGQNLKSGLL